MAPSKVIIVGGGLSGTLLANGLIRHEIDVVVYDRLDPDIKREGYQIRMGANALAGFRACLDKQQIKDIVSKFGKSGGRISSAPVIYGSDFQPILDLTKFPAYSKSAPINRVVLRDDLAALVQKTGKIHYKKQFERYEIIREDGKELVRVWFKDGSSDTGDILIGADGAHSKVNKQLGLDNIEPLSSHVSFVVKANLPISRFLQMTPALHRTPVLTFAENKSLYFCAYLPEKRPTDGGQVKSQVNFDDTMSSCMFGLYVPLETIPEGLLSKSAEEQWAFCRKSVSQWAPEFHEIVDLIKGASFHSYISRVGKEPSVDWRAKIRRDSKDDALGHPRVWLMGDAIHPMLPSRGMGGNQALRDTATILPLLVELFQDSQPTKILTTDMITKSLHSYEQEMIPRAFGWVKKSGGRTVVPFDTDKFYVRWGFLLVAPLMLVAYWFGKLAALVRNEAQVDDAPEFED